MARALSNYRTTKKPKVNTPSLDTTNPLNNYSDNKVVDGGASNNQGITPLDMYTNRGLQKADTSSLNMGNSTSLDITEANKQPVNNDLNYYTQLTNMKNKNDLLVEKYGLQGVRDQAVSDLAQQDVIRQQSDRALAEQLRATGLNSGAMSETMRGNLLMNYAGNVKDIQNNYSDALSNAEYQNQLDNYNSVYTQLDNLISSGNLSTYNSKEVLDMINNADINQSQKDDLLNYYNMAMASISGQEAEELPTGVTINDDGTYSYDGLTNISIPRELDIFINRDNFDAFMYALTTAFASGETYEEAKDNFVNNALASLVNENGEEYLKDHEKEYYKKYLRKFFDDSEKEAKAALEEQSKKQQALEEETKAKVESAKQTVKNTAKEAANKLKEAYGKFDQEKIAELNEKQQALENGKNIAWSKEEPGKVFIDGKEYDFGKPIVVSDNKVPSNAREIGKNTYIQGNYVYRKTVKNGKIDEVLKYQIVPQKLASGERYKTGLSNSEIQSNIKKTEEQSTKAENKRQEIENNLRNYASNGYSITQGEYGALNANIFGTNYQLASTKANIDEQIKSHSANKISGTNIYYSTNSGNLFVKENGKWYVINGLKYSDYIKNKK
jgi:hypothetical protein